MGMFDFDAVELEYAKQRLLLDKIHQALTKAGIKSTLQYDDVKIHTTEYGTELTCVIDGSDCKHFKFSDNLVSGPGSPNGQSYNFTLDDAGIDEFIYGLQVKMYKPFKPEYDITNHQAIYRNPDSLVRI